MIKVTELSGGNYGFSGTFAMAAPPSPSITVTYPVEYDYLIPNQEITITWIWTGQIEEVRIDLFTDVLLGYDPSMPLVRIAEGTVNTGSFNWTVIAPEIGYSYQIKVSAYDGSAYDEGGWFAIRGRMSFTFLSPEPGAVLVSGNEVAITWSCLGTMQLVDIYLLRDQGLVLQVAQNTMNDWSFEWQVPTDLEQGDNYSLLVEWTIDDDYVCESGRLSVSAEAPPPVYDFMPYVREGSYNISLPAGWEISEDAVISGAKIDVMLLGPTYGGFTTNILVQSGKDITVKENEAYLQGLIKDSMDAIASMGYQVSIYEPAVFGMYSGHMGGVFSMQWNSGEVVQKRLFVVSEEHSSYWFVTFSADGDSYQDLAPMFDQIISTFEITAEELPLGGFAGIVEMALIASVVTAIVVVGALVTLLIMRRRKRL